MKINKKLVFLFLAGILLVFDRTNLFADALQKIAKKISSVGKDLKNKKVAVLPLPYHDGRESKGSTIVSERLITKIVEQKKLEVIERSLLEKVFRELKLQTSGGIDEESAKQIGKVLGVEAIVSGTLIDLGEEEVEINARLIQAETGKILVASSGKVDRFWKDEEPKQKEVAQSLDKTSQKQEQTKLTQADAENLTVSEPEPTGPTIVLSNHPTGGYGSMPAHSQGDMGAPRGDFHPAHFPPNQQGQMVPPHQPPEGQMMPPPHGEMRQGAHGQMQPPPYGEMNQPPHGQMQPPPYGGMPPPPHGQMMTPPFGMPDEQMGMEDTDQMIWTGPLDSFLIEAGFPHEMARSPIGQQLLQGIILLKEGQPEAAEKHFLMLAENLRKEPRLRAMAKLGVGLSLFAEENKDKAKEELEDIAAFKQWPKISAAAHFILGRFSESLGEQRKAQDHYVEVIRLIPFQTLLVRNAGNRLRRMRSEENVAERVKMRRAMRREKRQANRDNLR
ncbi:MAG: hypothetical protein A3I11_08715 [Elusimicrobia bacterium RIFCSPLOWO2_02_FULL_39_32]|nr:MAG: hypothetical protein A3B80_06525 [Elusimicrobia bacterium RIFCSPHIGHO2_02_FULL_39_36]OGR91241.1 MAG: hypothetical protein A3I11_08715 [Elusimicrobia bacterium RIFCSPLOWO2_02_FULL_39_32]OGS00616.1 MAG: hypothetical protein A3G85_02610 [Elusimicrobia bacterium RIFCSPLOWO2_12_FULL_39_28]